MGGGEPAGLLGRGQGRERKKKIFLQRQKKKKTSPITKNTTNAGRLALPFRGGAGSFGNQGNLWALKKPGYQGQKMIPPGQSFGENLRRYRL